MTTFILLDGEMMRRIESVDVFRLFAVFMVIVLHTQPFRLDSANTSWLYENLDAFITNAARFAVPFFFIVSGYFWGVKIRLGEPPLWFSLRKIGRIFTVFLFWCVVYLVPYDMLGSGKPIWGLILDNIHTLQNQPKVMLLMQGTKLHLWFLVALMYSMGISAIFVRNKKILTLISVALFIIGVLAKAYEDTPMGLSLGFNTLYGPFFGTLFFVSGYHLSGIKMNTKWLLYGFFVFIFGCLLHGSEVWILWKMFKLAPYEDYVFGTYFMGIGYAMMAFSGHPALQNRLLGNAGKLALGIYAVQYMFVDLFSNYDMINNSIAWELGYVVIVFLLSLLTAYLLSLNKITKQFVA